MRIVYHNISFLLVKITILSASSLVRKAFTSITGLVGLSGCIFTISCKVNRNLWLGQTGSFQFTSLLSDCLVASVQLFLTLPRPRARTTPLVPSPWIFLPKACLGQTCTAFSEVWFSYSELLCAEWASKSKEVSLEMVDFGVAIGTSARWGMDEFWKDARVQMISFISSSKFHESETYLTEPFFKTLLINNHFKKTTLQSIVDQKYHKKFLNQQSQIINWLLKVFKK